MAVMSANGATCRTIAAEVGKSAASVSRALQTAEAKEIIERESNRLLKALPDITASSIQQVETSKRIHDAIAGNGELPGTFKDTSEAIQYAQLTAKRETDILKAVGLLATPAQSIFIQNIYNDNRKAVLNPTILNALSSIQQDDSIEDAEYIGGE